MNGFSNEAGAKRAARRDFGFESVRGRRASRRLDWHLRYFEAQWHAVEDVAQYAR